MAGEVVCMIRDGEAGRLVQEQAIQHAREHNRALIFLHVVDIGTLLLENETLESPAVREMTWIGNVNLNLARRRATAAGMQVQTVIRYGPIFETVITYLKESQAACLFLGASHPLFSDYEQRLERVKLFAKRLSDAAGIPVFVAE